MLYLNYIIIGKLPDIQRGYLLQNLTGDSTGRRKAAVRGLDKEIFSGKEGDRDRRWDEESLCRFPAEESILISGDAGELRTAAALGMAALGFDPVEMLTDADSGAAGGDGKTQECRAPVQEQSGEKEEKGKADMYAEGFEEIGLTFLQHVYERHHHLPWRILETERCVVKEFSMEYLDDLFELYAGEGMTNFIEPLYPYEREKEYQRAYMEYMYGFYGYGMWIVCEKETGKLIGRAGVEHREELGGELELGYAIGVPYQRQGYATEVCRAILSYVEEELERKTIYCLIQEGNTASERFAEKLGFSFCEILELDGKHMKKYVLDL